MPRRKRLPVAVPLPHRPAIPLRDRSGPGPQLIPFGLPDLDAALGGGLPLGRLTEIIGATPYGSVLLTAQFIARRQRLAPNGSVVWVALGAALDLDLLRRAGVATDRVTVLTPRDGAEALHRVFAHLLGRPSHLLVISGLPQLARRDLLFITLLERLALALPGTRTVLVCLSRPESTGPALARLAAVRLALANEQLISERSDAHSGGRIVFAADLTVLKHRFSVAGRQVALRLPARPQR